MRIGIFTDTYPPYINGVSTSIAMLEKGLRDKGHEVFIVTVNPDNMGYKYEENDHIIRIPGIPIGIYDYRLSGIYPIRAVNKIKKWNLDIIHSHTEFGVGTFARIIAKQYDIPLVHTYHTMYEDYVYYVTKGYFDKSSKKIVEYLTKFYCDKTAKELIVPSKKTYDLFTQKYKVEKTIHLVPTGIDTARFYKEKFKASETNSLKQELGIAKEDFVILYVGRLAHEKSVDFLIKNQVDLVKKYPNCKLVIVGSGPDYENFIELSKSLKMENHIIFTNAIPYDDVPSYYQIANVFATASTTETQGLTVVEAMAASKPVVCINDESFNCVVVDGLNGHLFENKKDYLGCVIDLMEHPGKCMKMAEQARISAEKYSLKYYAEQVLDVYKAALSGVKKEPGLFDKLMHAVKKGDDE